MATRIPINKETGSGIGFEDRQKRIWEEMESDMERRRREWEEEIEKMRKEFFMLRPEAGGEGGRSVAGGMGVGGGGPASSAMPLGFGERIGPRSRLLDTTSASADESRGMVVKDDKGNPVFKVLFDVHDYRPEEVSVKMDANKIMVSAHHEASQGGSSVSREYKREVKIPNELDPMTLQCTMGPDGILAVEAPIPAPSYAAIKDSTRTGSPGLSTGSPRQSTSSSTSSTSYQTYQTPPLRGAPSSTSAAVGAAGAAPPPEPVLPAGFKPVSAPFLNNAPPPPASSLSGSSALGAQPGSSSSISSASYTRDTSSPLSSGFSTASQPYQPSSLSNSSQQATTAHHSFHSPPIKSVTSSGGRIGSPVVLSESGKFKLEIDIEDFKPEELTVKTQDKRVVICAKREEKVGNRSSTRELSREYTIPDTVDPLTIKAFFTDGGKLIIEAPYRDLSLMS